MTRAIRRARSKKAFGRLSASLTWISDLTRLLPSSSITALTLRIPSTWREPPLQMRSEIMQEYISWRFNYLLYFFVSFVGTLTRSACLVMPIRIHTLAHTLGKNPSLLWTNTIDHIRYRFSIFTHPFTLSMLSPIANFRDGKETTTMSRCTQEAQNAGTDLSDRSSS